MGKPLQFIVPDRVAEMAADAAKHRGCSVAAYSRQGLYAALRADGVDPTGAPRNGWGGQEWALVIAGEIKATGPFADKPAAEQGGTWLPIEQEDSAPFDPDRHYRLSPTMRVEASRVVRTYPVVDKSEAV